MHAQTEPGLEFANMISFLNLEYEFVICQILSYLAKDDQNIYG